MTLAHAAVQPVGDNPPDREPDFYEQTRFWPSARRYGLRDLLATPATGASAVAAAGVTFLYLDDDLKTDGLQALGIAYLSLAAALFGIVLAGLAVVAAFFDREYVAQLRRAGTLRSALFGFWWVATLAVSSLSLSVALTVAVYAGAQRGVVAPLLALATFLFFGALLDALSLVGTLMRHGLYRAELARSSTEM